MDPRELETEPFIAREGDSYTRALTEAALAHLGIVLQPCMELRGPEGVKAAVRAGLGVSIISISTLRLELEARVLRTIPLRGLRIERPFVAIRLASANGGNGGSSKVASYLLSMLGSPDLAKP